MKALQGILLLNDLLAVSITLLEKSQRMAAVLSRAQQEGRDLTEAEWNGLIQDDNVARLKLKQAIDGKGGDQANDTLT